MQNDSQYPAWMNTLVTKYTSGQAHAFTLHFNVRDHVVGSTPLVEYLFEAFAVKPMLVRYNLADGISFALPTMRDEYDRYVGLGGKGDTTNDALAGLLGGAAPQASNEKPPLPKAPAKALAQLETLLRNAVTEKIDPETQERRTVGQACVVIEYAESIIPQADIAMMSPDDRAIKVTLERLGADRFIAETGNVLILITENLSDVHQSLRRATAKYEQIEIPLPSYQDRLDYITARLEISPLEFAQDLTVAQFASETAMLSRVHIEDICLRAQADGAMTRALIAERKNEIIRAEFGEVIEVMDPQFGFDDIGGLGEVKEFFKRSVINPMRAGNKQRVPMGVLMTGPAGCLAKGTPVLMFDGSIKPVEDVEEGDLLMGPDSRPRRVRLLARGREEMYRVTPQKGDAYVTNRSHILSLRMSYAAGWHKQGEVVNMTIAEYLEKSKSFQQAAKGWRTGVEFAERDVPIPAYLLGLWLGDGSSHHGNVLTTQDAEVVQYLTEFANANELEIKQGQQKGKAFTYRLVRAERYGKRGGRIEDRKNFLRDAMHDLDVIQNKHVPTQYKINSRAVRLEILAGLIDTDGCLSDGGYDFVSKFEPLADDVVYLARSLGFAAYKKRTIKCSQSGIPGLYWRIFISGNISEIPVRVERRKAQPRKQIKDVLNVGIKVESVGEDDYYGFEIDGDGLFLLGDFTVTHNTGKSIMAQAVAKESGVNCVVLNPAKLFGQYVGMTERNLDRALKAVEAMAPTIVFVDEIDQTVNRSSGGGDSGVSARFFKRLLEFMSDTSHRGSVVFLAATNRPDLMDAALKRPGRFDKKIPFLVPDDSQRESIFKVMCRRYGLGNAVKISKAALEKTNGWTGAEIEGAVVKALELMYDEELKSAQAVDEAVKRLRPSTADIELMTLLAIQECGDTDLLPAKYRAQLEDRAALENEIATRKEARTAPAQRTARKM